MKLFELRPFLAWLSTRMSSVKNPGSICPHPRSWLPPSSGLSAIVESPIMKIVVTSRVSVRNEVSNNSAQSAGSNFVFMF